MSDQHLVAYCGMNCALCVNYQAQHFDLKKQGFNRQYCPGCRPRGKHCTHMQAHCDLIGKGVIDYCYQCEQFPGRRLKNLDLRYRTKYHLRMIENLQYIKDQGLEQFLSDQDVKWRCPHCGKLICCHNGLCLNCELEVLKKNKRYRWGEV